MLKKSAARPPTCKARQHTEHDQRENAEVKPQHVRLLVPRQAIFGQDSEQFSANGLLCRRVSIVTHLVGVESWWRRRRGTTKCQKMTMDAPPAPLSRSSKPACSVSKESVVYTLEGFNRDVRDGTLASLPCPRFGGIETPSADASRKLHIRLQTSESSLRSVDHVGEDSAGGRGVRPVPKRYFPPSTRIGGLEVMPTPDVRQLSCRA